MKPQVLQHIIYEIREQKVMLDFDLARLYKVETRALKQAVKRNKHRFPGDFIFTLTAKEINALVSQNVIPSKSYFGGSSPYAFTEQGVAMLSSVLKSRKAVEVNVAIMRAFVFLRQYAITHKDLTQKLKELETKYDRQFRDIYDAINYLMKKDRIQQNQTERKKIGYKK